MSTGINYFQSVTPSLSMGGEAFWLGQQRKSGTGFAARHQGEQHVATCQLATTGLINATYIHKVNEKVNSRFPFQPLQRSFVRTVLGDRAPRVDLLTFTGEIQSSGRYPRW